MVHTMRMDAAGVAAGVAEAVAEEDAVEDVAGDRREGLVRVSDFVPELFVRRLSECLGDNHLMTALYGSAARDDFVPGHSDVNLLIVAGVINGDVLKALARVLQEARLSFRCAPLVLTRAELIGSADVFSIKLGEIRNNYVIITGTDLLRDLRVDSSELARSCEYELRNISLKLRKAYLIGCPDPSALHVAIRQFVPQLLAVLRAAASGGLIGSCEGPEGGLEERVLSALDLPADGLALAVRLRRERDPSWPEVESAYLFLAELLERAVVRIVGTDPKTS